MRALGAEGLLGVVRRRRAKDTRAGRRLSPYLFLIMLAKRLAPTREPNAQRHHHHHRHARHRLPAPSPRPRPRPRQVERLACNISVNTAGPGTERARPRHGQLQERCHITNHGPWGAVGSLVVFTSLSTEHLRRSLINTPPVPHGSLSDMRLLAGTATCSK